MDNVNVTTFNGVAYDEDAVKNKIGAIPYSTGASLVGTKYSTGPGSLVFDSGCIFFECSNGMVYCFNTDLEMIWSYQMGGSTYYNSPTVFDSYVFTGALNGHLYINNKRTGALISDEHIFTRVVYDKTYGSVNNVAVFKTDENTYTLFASFTDGRGMSSVVGGLTRLTFNGVKILTKDVDDKTYGMLTNYLLPAKLDGFTGVYFTATNGFFKVDLNGKYFNLNSGVLPEVHAPATMVNNSKIYLTAYTAGKDNYILDTDGKILYQMEKPERVRNYGMSPATIIGDYVFYGNDSGMYTVYGVFPEYVPPEPGSEKPWWETALVVLIVIAAILAVVWLVLRFVAKKEKPFHYLGGLVVHYLGSDDYTHNTKSKHRLWIILIGGTAVLLVIFMVSLCLGSSDILSPGEALSALFSAIGKGGNDLSYNETLVYSSRFPRALAAVAVGIGLSIAGSIYQAIIRNPLVDPYIMGISSGAGTAAIAVIAFDFTLFGLFSPHSPYLVAVTAMIGGIIAYACTTIIAQKAGGTSINYVLAGVVVGLAFSAVQTLMMSMAGHKVTNVLTWLFGSFANVSWTQLWLIVIPAIALSLAPLIWAKEFNLVLLGEDQAKQMGLNVRIFTIAMLTLASVLTSVCVAFVGVIGFVGLVVPHLCRMFIGGDHRLVMPTSIVIGGILMLLADLAARMIFYGQELPVGAITTIIGVPVFAWLLIKRGRMYDG